MTQCGIQPSIERGISAAWVNCYLYVLSDIPRLSSSLPFNPSSLVIWACNQAYYKLGVKSAISLFSLDWVDIGTLSLIYLRTRKMIRYFHWSTSGEFQGVTFGMRMELFWSFMNILNMYSEAAISATLGAGQKYYITRGFLYRGFLILYKPKNKITSWNRYTNPDPETTCVH